MESQVTVGFDLFSCQDMPGVIMHQADEENDSFLLVSFTRQDTSEPQRELQTLAGS